MSEFSSNYHPRGYRHIDDPIGLKRAEGLATTPAKVAKHSFYPFIRREVKTLKYSNKTRRKSEKIRIIHYASHADSAIFGWYSTLLENLYEDRIRPSTFNDVPLAYRKFQNKRCNIHFAKDIFDFIKRATPCAVFCFDIEGFFDNLDHDLLLAEWKALLGVTRLPSDHWVIYKNLTSYSWIDEQTLRENFGALSRRKPRLHEKYGPLSRSKPKQNNKKLAQPPLFSLFRDTKRQSRFCLPTEFRQLRKDGHINKNQKAYGIPQGSPMSAVISNIYMIPFDKQISNYANAVGGFYRRYSDDIIVVVPQKHLYGVEFTIKNAIKERKLKIQDKKTESAIFDKNGKCDKRHIQYLGFTYDGSSIRLRSQTLGKANSRVYRHLFHSYHASNKNGHYPDLYKRKFLIRFSSRGKRNFIAYGKRCVEIFGCPTLKDQVERHKAHNLYLMKKRKALKDQAMAKGKKTPATK